MDYTHLGSSELMVSRIALGCMGFADPARLATKVGMRMHDGATGSGLSHAAILEQIDASLTRLGTDYVDLYQIHRFDPTTPAGETMQALHEVVAAGKARYLGASSMWRGSSPRCSTPRNCTGGRALCRCRTSTT